MSGIITNIIYEVDSGRIVVINVDDRWILPGDLDLAHFENGVEPVLSQDEYGDLYLTNKFIVNDW